jgi:hypothetical protein
LIALGALVSAERFDSGSLITVLESIASGGRPDGRQRV